MKLHYKTILIENLFFIFCYLIILNNPIVSFSRINNIPFLKSKSIKVISYNIHYGVNSHKQPNLKKIISFLQNTNADIICLQEVDNKTFRALLQNQPDCLKKNLLMEYKYTTTENFFPGQTGNMILSRFPIISFEDYLLPSNQYQRKIQQAMIETPLGNIVVFNTHLGLSKSIRSQQIKAIVKLIENTQEPFILAGDMNTSNLSELENIYQYCIDSGILMKQESIPTFKNKIYENRIDYLFTSKEFTINNYEVPSLMYSDHEPVIINIE